MAALAGGCRGRPDGPPRLRLAEPLHDFGRVNQGAELAASLGVINAGAAPLQIESVRAGHSCSGRVEPDTLARGAAGRLEVRCRAALHGRFNDALILTTNDPAARESRQTLVAEVNPLLAFDKPLLALEMPWGESRRQELRLTGARAREARLTLKSSGDPALTVGASTSGALLVEFSGDRPGVHQGAAVFTTGLDDPALLSLPYNCKVAGTLEVTPTNPTFNLREPGDKARVLDVHSTQPGLVVRAATVLEGPFTASLEGSGGRYRIRVAVVVSELDDETRAVTGRLLITSNDRAEPRREVSLLAFGKLNRAGAVEE